MVNDESTGKYVPKKGSELLKNLLYASFLNAAVLYSTGQWFKNKPCVAHSLDKQKQPFDFNHDNINDLLVKSVDGTAYPLFGQPDGSYLTAKELKKLPQNSTGSAKLAIDEIVEDVAKKYR